MKRGAWKSGRPNQLALSTPAKETRGGVSIFPAPALKAVMSPNILSASHESTKPTTSATRMPMRPMNPLNRPMTRNATTIVISAIHWSCGQ